MSTRVAGDGGAEGLLFFCLLVGGHVFSPSALSFRLALVRVVWLSCALVSIARSVSECRCSIYVQQAQHQQRQQHQYISTDAVTDVFQNKPYQGRP